MENEDDSDSDTISFPEDEKEFKAILQGIREYDPNTDTLSVSGVFDYIQNMTDEDWEDLGIDISNNDFSLKNVNIVNGALNDHKMSCLFRGLTGSCSIGKMCLHNNELSVAAVRSMESFFQNASNLTHLELHDSNIQSEGFNELLRALYDRPVVMLQCIGCGIESIEIDNEHIPKYLESLVLIDNRINADGCRELAKLLPGAGGNATWFAGLYLAGNNIDDEGVAILADALSSNTSLETLDLKRNDGISKQGQIMLLKLVSDVSSIKAAMQSNHTLIDIWLDPPNAEGEMQTHIDAALAINKMIESMDIDNLEEAGRMKVIQAQLHSVTRTRFANLQGVDHSLYSEINPLHLPEVIALVGKNHDQGELYMSLKSAIAGLLSTVNWEQCLQKQSVCPSGLVDLRSDSPSGIKRRRV